MELRFFRFVLAFVFGVLATQWVTFTWQSGKPAPRIEIGEKEVDPIMHTIIATINVARVDFKDVQGAVVSIKTASNTFNEVINYAYSYSDDPEFTGLIQQGRAVQQSLTKLSQDYATFHHWHNVYDQSLTPQIESILQFISRSEWGKAKEHMAELARVLNILLEKLDQIIAQEDKVEGQVEIHIQKGEIAKTNYYEKHARKQTLEGNLKSLNLLLSAAGVGAGIFLTGGALIPALAAGAAGIGANAVIDSSISKNFNEGYAQIYRRLRTLENTIDGSKKVRMQLRSFRSVLVNVQGQLFATQETIDLYRDHVRIRSPVLENMKKEVLSTLGENNYLI